MSTLTDHPTQRERELGAIITAYNEVTDQLKQSHERLVGEVRRLREELAKKNQQLRRRERLAALGEMAAGVAHEIRNPLGGVRLYASLLQRDLADRPQALTLAEKIAACVGRLEAIVADILIFARPADPRPSRVALGALVAETVELASATIEKAGATVNVADDLADVELVTDVGLLQRALLNLLRNAVEAAASTGPSPPPRRVEVALAHVADDRITLAVRDNGPGIPSDSLDRIFNPFFTTKDEGLGLGLAIVHQIAAVLGGSVQAANRPEGGAVFSLSVPRRLNEA